MGFMDELKKLAKPYTEDEDDFDEFDDDVRPTRASRSSSAPAPSRAPSFDLDDTDDDISSSFGSGNTSTRRTPGNNKVVNIHNTAQMRLRARRQDQKNRHQHLYHHALQRGYCRRSDRRA